MFLPAFSFTLLFYDRLERVIEDARLHHFLEGVAAGVVAFIAVTAVQLGQHVAGSVPSLPAAALVFAASLLLLYRFKHKLVPVAMVLLSGICGVLLLR